MRSRAKRQAARTLDVAHPSISRCPTARASTTIESLHLAAPRVPLVVLSGQRDVDVAVDAMRHGAQDYVLKSNADQRSRSCARREARDRAQAAPGRRADARRRRQPRPARTAADRRPSRATCSSRSSVGQHATVLGVLRAQRAAKRATALVNDLLDATRARLAGDAAPRRGPRRPREGPRARRRRVPAPPPGPRDSSSMRGSLADGRRREAPLPGHRQPPWQRDPAQPVSTKVTSRLHGV